MKNKIKILIILIIISFIFIIIGLGEKNQIENSSQQSKEETNLSHIYKDGNNNAGLTSEILSYNDFQMLFEDMVNKFVIPNYSLINSTIGFDIIKIEKEISFGKREYLTISGSYDSLPQSTQNTQETLFYLNENKDKLLTITLAYTDKLIGNDIVFFNITSGFGIDDKLTTKSNLVTISYKNLIISILQTSSKQTSIVDTIEATKHLVEYLQSK